MRFSILLAMAGLAGTGTALANSPTEGQLPPQVVGGWTEGRVDSDTHRVARFALRHLHRRGARIRSIETVHTQVVAGINFRILMTLTDGSQWQVVVWKRLDNLYQFTGGTRIPSA